MAKPAGPALILAGFGSSSPLQLTIEAQQMAAHVGHVLALGLPERLRTYLDRHSVEVTSLDELFEGRPLAEAYAAVCQLVLARADETPPVMFLSQGNPLLLNVITRYLVAEANRRALTVRVLPGVSPIDVVVAEFGIDVGRSGLQSLAAAGFTARPSIVSPRMPLLLLEVAGLAQASSSAEAYGPLFAALGGIYPENQPVTLVNLATEGGVGRLTVRLDQFAELIAHIDTSSCLFIDVRRKARPATATKEN